MEVKDRAFSLHHHTSCYVHGGDGLALVMHGHDNRSRTLGTSGDQIGYGGIENSVAIEFDTWYNPGTSDLFRDHIAIHTNGRSNNKANGNTHLGVPRKHNLADGRVHYVKVAYYPEIQYKYWRYLSASKQVNMPVVPFGPYMLLTTLSRLCNSFGMGAKVDVWVCFLSG